MIPIKNLLPSILHVIPTDHSWKCTIIQEWSNIMGRLASKISIDTIQHNTITLNVIDSCWMQELYTLSEMIKTKINQKLHKPYIQKIRFKHAAQSQVRIQAVSNSISYINDQRIITQREKQALECIKDPELSDALMRLLQKCHPSS